MSVLVPIQAQEMHPAHPGQGHFAWAMGALHPGTNGHAAIPEPEC
jgi:hypothetical protein